MFSHYWDLVQSLRLQINLWSLNFRYDPKLLRNLLTRYKCQDAFSNAKPPLHHCWNGLIMSPVVWDVGCVWAWTLNWNLSRKCWWAKVLALIAGSTCLLNGVIRTLSPKMLHSIVYTFICTHPPCIELYLVTFDQHSVSAIQTKQTNAVFQLLKQNGSCLHVYLRLFQW